MSSVPPHAILTADPSAVATILLVEDEPAIRTLTCRILRRRGYTVLEATDGTEALEVAAAHEGAIDLLLTDLVMPGVGGAEVATRLGTARPALQVIFMSGYGVEDLQEHGVSGCAHFLGKPFRPDELIAKVLQALA